MAQDLGDTLRDAAQDIRDKANQAKGRIDQAMDDAERQDDMDQDVV